MMLPLYDRHDNSSLVKRLFHEKYLVRHNTKYYMLCVHIWN